MDRRTLNAITVTFAILILYQIFLAYYFPPAVEDPAATAATQAAASATVDGAPAAVPSPAGVGNAPPPLPDQTAAAVPVAVTPPVAAPVVGQPEVSFGNELLSAKVAVQGGRLVGVEFSKFKDQLGPDGKPIRFLSPEAERLFWFESGVVAAQAGAAVPDHQTVWGSASLDQGKGVRLTWTSPQGVTFIREYRTTAGSYFVEFTETIQNGGTAPYLGYHYSQFKRVQPEVTVSDAVGIIDFLGPVGFVNGGRVVQTYEDLQEKESSFTGGEGWVGFNDKYFLATILATPAAGSAPKYYFDYAAPFYRVGRVTGKFEVAASTSTSFAQKLFIGPKALHTLEQAGGYLDRAIDYGWFHFLAVPLVEMLLFFNNFFHNFGIAIILLTVIIKVLFFPLATKSYISMNAMKRLQPKMENLKRIHGDDKQALNQEMIKLYQEEKVNPLGGCLPILVQIPVFLALYKALSLSVELRHAPFFGWIVDLAEMDPYYVLPLLMGASMVIQTKLNPTPPDPVQAKLMMFLPLIFTVMFLNFPSGLVLYWLVNNVLSIAQQWYIMKRHA